MVQAALKLVLEPIFEAEFLAVFLRFPPETPGSGRDGRDSLLHDPSRCYEWIVEGDIKACFDEIAHSALMDRVRRRVGDKRVLALVKAFLKAGILTEDRHLEDTTTGTPQGRYVQLNISRLMNSAGLCAAPAGSAW